MWRPGYAELDYCIIWARVRGSACTSHDACRARAPGLTWRQAHTRSLPPAGAEPCGRSAMVPSGGVSMLFMALVPLLGAFDSLWFKLEQCSAPWRVRAQRLAPRVRRARRLQDAAWRRKRKAVVIMLMLAESWVPEQGAYMHMRGRERERFDGGEVQAVVAGAASSLLTPRRRRLLARTIGAQARLVARSSGATSTQPGHANEARPPQTAPALARGLSHPPHSTTPPRFNRAVVESLPSVRHLRVDPFNSHRSRRRCGGYRQCSAGARGRCGGRGSTVLATGATAAVFTVCSNVANDNSTAAHQGRPLLDTTCSGGTVAGKVVNDPDWVVLNYTDSPSWMHVSTLDNITKVHAILPVC